MKVCSGLAVFACYGVDSYVLTNYEGGLPRWDLSDSPLNSLALAQKKLEEITNISSSWNIPLRQSGFFESCSAEKLAVVVYTVYFPAKQELAKNSNCQWLKLSDLSNNDEFSSVLRYLAAQRN